MREGERGGKREGKTSNIRLIEGLSEPACLPVAMRRDLWVNLGGEGLAKRLQSKRAPGRTSSRTKSADRCEAELAEELGVGSLQTSPFSGPLKTDRENPVTTLGKKKA